MYARKLGVEVLESRELLSVTADTSPYPVATHSQSGPRLGPDYNDNGVQFGYVRVGMVDAEVQVIIGNAAARLDAWIDFNGDGSFSGPNEHIFDAVSLAVGTHLLEFDVPSWAVSWADGGPVNSRFRVSTQITGVGQGGSVTGGEVEDYQLFIDPATKASGDFGAVQNIYTGSQMNGPFDVITADLNGDGDLEVITASYIDGRITVFERGTSSWTRTVINTIPSISGNELFSMGLAADDLDGDGDIDIAVSSSEENSVYWLQNLGSIGTNSFTRRLVASGLEGVQTVIIADFDRDGRNDLASASLNDDRLNLHRNIGNVDEMFQTSFRTLVFDPTAIGVSVRLSDIYAADVDGDGWVDLVTAERNRNRVAVYESPVVNGARSPFSNTTPWVLGSTVLAGSNGTADRAYGVFVADMDGDNDMDVVVSNFDGDQIVWIRHNSGGSWSSPINIANSANGINGPVFPQVADIDGDGDMDVVVPLAEAGQIRAYSNSGGSFSLLDSITFTAPRNAFIADIDGNGTLDIVAVSLTGDQVAWFSNPAAPDVAVFGEEIFITDGDTTPRVADGTDFGTAAQGGATVSRTFTVTNTGAGTLTLSGLVVPTGFTLTEGLSSSLAPGATDTFTIRLETTTLGTKAGNVSFNNNSAGESPYTFRITGTVANTPDAEVEGNGIVILDGDTSPDASDGTNFGSAAQGGPTVDRIFTVFNRGTATLTLSALTVPTGYSIVNGLVASLAAGASDTFTIRLLTTTAGTKSGNISFTTNSPGETTYNFAITGSVTTEPELTVIGLGDVIVDGDATPSFDDGTNFGFIAQGTAGFVRTFTIRNDGSSTLNLANLTVPAGFTISNTLTSTLAPGASDVIGIRLNATTLGVKSGVVSFTSNDADESPFTFSITGQVVLPGDYNGNGEVTGLDYNVWKSNFGSTNRAADGNGDGVVNLADYTIWRDNLGASAGAVSAIESPAVVPAEAPAQLSDAPTTPAAKTSPLAASSTSLVGSSLNAPLTKSSATQSPTITRVDATLLLRSGTLSSRESTTASSPIKEEHATDKARDLAFQNWSPFEEL
ncbi:choice-of-anchor D domain-containing protein [Aeoliella sp. SH292]|uniref:choice-of-anchor D domain-containing protein n=1 Tax=Aeoliella sp. SH292 TaxID=3454464 RepID=UPI003F960C48